MGVRVTRQSSRVRGVIGTQPILFNGKMLKIHFLLLLKANACNICTFSYLFGLETCLALICHPIWSLKCKLCPEKSEKSTILMILANFRYFDMTSVMTSQFEFGHTCPVVLYLVPMDRGGSKLSLGTTFIHVGCLITKF